MTVRAAGTKKPHWMYSFNMTNDGCKLALDTQGTVLTTFQAVYTKLMNTWNKLLAADQEKVTMTITVELPKNVIDTKPTIGTLSVLDDTFPEEIDTDMMSALIAEPLLVVPPYQQMQIPLAVNKKLIDAEDGIIPDDANIGEDTSDVMFNGYGTNENWEGTKGEDAGEDKETGDAEQDEESGGESDI